MERKLSIGAPDPVKSFCCASTKKDVVDVRQMIRDLRETTVKKDPKHMSASLAFRNKIKQEEEIKEVEENL